MIQQSACVACVATCAVVNPVTTGGVTVLLAEHDAVVPPLDPVQLHVQGPEPATDVATPDEQRFALGVEAIVVPLVDPHDPDTATGVVGVVVAVDVAVVGAVVVDVTGGTTGGIAGVVDPLGWLSELAKNRNHILSAIQNLEAILV